MPLDTATITASYRAILRMPPDLQGFVATTYTDVDGLNGQLLVEAQDSTVPALTMFDVMFGATPAWAGGLDYLTTYVRGLETQGFSLQNVYVNLGASFIMASPLAGQYAAHKPKVISRKLDPAKQPAPV